jgi:hypothetical protein
MKEKKSPIQHALRSVRLCVSEVTLFSRHLHGVDLGEEQAQNPFAVRPRQLSQLNLFKAVGQREVRRGGAGGYGEQDKGAMRSFGTS